MVVRLTIIKPSVSISDMLHCHHATTTYLYKLPVNFNGGNIYCPLKLNVLQNSLWDQLNVLQNSLWDQASNTVVTAQERVP